MGSTGAGVGCLAAPSYHCSLKMPPLSLHLSFPSPPDTPSSKRLGGSWWGSGQGGKTLTPGFAGAAARPLCSERMQRTRLERPAQLPLEVRALSEACSLIFQLKSERTGLGGSSVTVSICYSFASIAPTIAAPQCHSQPSRWARALPTPAWCLGFRGNPTSPH